MNGKEWHKQEVLGAWKKIKASGNFMVKHWP